MLHFRLPLFLSAISNATSQREFYITNLQRGENYVLWMTASTAAGESPWGNRELVCLESNESLGPLPPAERFCPWPSVLHALEMLYTLFNCWRSLFSAGFKMHHSFLCLPPLVLCQAAVCIVASSWLAALLIAKRERRVWPLQVACPDIYAHQGLAQTCLRTGLACLKVSHEKPHCGAEAAVTSKSTARCLSLCSVQGYLVWALLLCCPGDAKASPLTKAFQPQVTEVIRFCPARWLVLIIFVLSPDQKNPEKVFDKICAQVLSKSFFCSVSSQYATTGIRVENGNLTCKYSTSQQPQQARAHTEHKIVTTALV